MADPSTRPAMERQQLEEEEEVVSGLLTLHCDNAEGNWKDLPYDVLDSITDRIFAPKDYIRFGAVCRSWRVVYTHNLDRHCPPCGLPLLMVPPPPPLPETKEEDDLGWNQKRSVYSLSKDAVISNLELPVPHDRYCRGSSHGWLVTLHQNLNDMRLLHPFSGTEIHLPNASALPHMELEIYNQGFITKVTLSANPSANPNYVAMAIYGQQCRLALFKPSDHIWTPLDFDFQGMEDIIYWRDGFYAVHDDGHVVSYDPHHPQPKFIIVDAPPRTRYSLGDVKLYLADSDGDLLRITRLIKFDDAEDYTTYHTCYFEVYRLETSTSTWSPLHHLGGRALFVGNNSSMSILASNFPGCMSDCIYFTDDDPVAYFPDGTGPHDIGVFNLIDKTLQKHFLLTNSNIASPNPIWIEPPSLQRCCN